MKHLSQIFVLLMVLAENVASDVVSFGEFNPGRGQTSLSVSLAEKLCPGSDIRQRIRCTLRSHSHSGSMCLCMSSAGCQAIKHDAPQLFVYAISVGSELT